MNSEEDDRCGWCGGRGAVADCDVDGADEHTCPECHGFGTESRAYRTFTRCQVCGDELNGRERQASMGMCFDCAAD
jgi:ribosomal protein L37AE/L43A